MLGKLAGIDSEVSAAETKEVEAYCEKELRLDRKTKSLALKVYRDAFDSPTDLSDYAEKFFQTYPDSVQLHDNMIKILLEVSASDGRIDPREERIIRSAALLLGLTEAGFERIKADVCGVMIH